MSFVAWMHEHQQQAIDVVVVLELCVRECIARVERVLASVAMMSAGLTHNRWRASHTTVRGSRWRLKKARIVFLLMAEPVSALALRSGPTMRMLGISSSSRTIHVSSIQHLTHIGESMRWSISLSRSHTTT